MSALLALATDVAPALMSHATGVASVATDHGATIANSIGDIAQNAHCCDINIGAMCTDLFNTAKTTLASGATDGLAKLSTFWNDGAQLASSGAHQLATSDFGKWFQPVNEITAKAVSDALLPHNAYANGLLATSLGDKLNIITPPLVIGSAVDGVGRVLVNATRSPVIQSVATTATTNPAWYSPFRTAPAVGGSVMAT
jgi:hypothetical protein